MWVEIPVKSVHRALESLLARVRKPIQYVGGEVGSVTKNWDAAAVRWVLCYPDAYAVQAPQRKMLTVVRPVPR